MTSSSSYWSSSGSEDYKNNLAYAVSDPSLKKDAPANILRLHRNVFCREIADDISELKSGVLLSDGEFIFRSGNYCGDIRLSSPFDSAQLQLSTPIYYFNGERDPATPMTQARYHFEHQTLAKRYFVTVRGGGHNPLTANLGDCGKEVWKSILVGGNELQGALSACELSTVVEVQESGVRMDPFRGIGSPEFR